MVEAYITQPVMGKYQVLRVIQTPIPDGVRSRTVELIGNYATPEEAEQVRHTYEETL